MCGIFGYVGEKDPLEMCLHGLEQLEYRGYDSSGIAGVTNGQIAFCKEAGKLSVLKSKLKYQKLDVAIGHTRWATHGKVTNQNAHPLFDTNQDIAIVHNGIIENHHILKEELLAKGVSFSSETDTEIVVHLVAQNYRGDFLEAVQKTLLRLQGHFAICLIHKNHPDQIIAAARDCSLSLAYDDKLTESIVSSDPNAFLGPAFNILFLRNDESARIQKGKIEIFDKNQKLVSKKTERLEGNYQRPSKNGYDHFMIKEIFEQPRTIQKALLGRFETGQVQFEECREDFRHFRNVWFIGCGTSSHAGSIGALLLEDIAGITAHSEIASEARYRVIPKNTLIVAISQSGETADTISAVREIRQRGFKVLSICNVQNSTLPRESDASIFLKAGPEISVCSTKAFTSQIAVLYLFALYMAKANVDAALQHIPQQIEQVLQNAPFIEKIGKKYSHFTDFFFMGRRYMFATCLEAALKLKEISYVNANGYPAGELKHGPIALLDSHFPVIAFASNKQTEEKMLSNLQEVKARGAPLLVFAPTHLKAIAAIADDVIWLPDTTDLLAPFAATVAGQLLAYYIAKERGCNIDQPRNLAKSVTVE